MFSFLTITTEARRTSDVGMVSESIPFVGPTQLCFRSRQCSTIRPILSSIMVFRNCCNKDYDLIYSVYKMVHIKYVLRLIRKNSPLRVGSGYPVFAFWMILFHMFDDAEAVTCSRVFQGIVLGLRSSHPPLSRTFKTLRQTSYVSRVRQTR